MAKKPTSKKPASKREPAGRRRRGGAVALASTLPGIAKATLGKHGFDSADVITRWPDIVGPDLAAHTAPIKLSFPKGVNAGGTLHMRVTGAAATELQHSEPQVLERINFYFGYRAVARLQLVQGFVLKPARPARQRVPPPMLDAGEQKALDQSVAAIEDDGLKSALAGLGRAVNADQKRRRKP